MTTDEDERNLRRMRAETEKMSVRFLGDKAIAPFGDYEVASEEAGLKKSYRVEFRSLRNCLNTCSCPDFRKNGLGTCKHIERVALRVRREAKSVLQSPVGEVFVRRNPLGVAFLRGTAMTEGAAESIARHFTADGALRIDSPLAIEALLTTCERLNRKTPGTVRVSADVPALAREMRELTDPPYNVDYQNAPVVMSREAVARGRARTSKLSTRRSSRSSRRAIRVVVVSSVARSKRRASILRCPLRFRHVRTSNKSNGCDDLDYNSLFHCLEVVDYRAWFRRFTASCICSCI